MRWFFLILTFLVITAAISLRSRGDKFSRPPFELFPDMDRQFKVKFQKPSDLFEDGVGTRRAVQGTVPMGFNFPISKEAGLVSSSLDFSVGDDYYNTGMFGDFYGKGLPDGFVVDEALLARGEQRYQINCVPCHGNSGNGKGIVSKFWGVPPVQGPKQSDEEYQKELNEFQGLPPTSNLLDPRVVAFPEGQIFWTITHGKGLMGSYGGTVNVKDRWAIVAYVKALQAAAK